MSCGNKHRLYVQVSAREMLHIKLLASHYKMLISTMMCERISLSTAVATILIGGHVKFRTHVWSFVSKTALQQMGPGFTT